MNVSRPIVIALGVGFVFGLSVSYLFINTQVSLISNKIVSFIISISEIFLQYRLLDRSPVSLGVL